MASYESEELRELRRKMRSSLHGFESEFDPGELERLGDCIDKLEFRHWVSLREIVNRQGDDSEQQVPFPSLGNSDFHWESVQSLESCGLASGGSSGQVSENYRNAFVTATPLGYKFANLILSQPHLGL
jgi:hypothetical protein